MRQLILIFILLLFAILTNCSNKKTSTTYKETDRNDYLQETFIPACNGVWVLTEYIKSIETTHSPLKSVDKLNGIVTMIIEITNQVDSFEVGVSWNNHEGDNFITYFSPGHRANSLKTNLEDFENKFNYYEIGLEMINNQIVLVLYHYNNDNKLIDKKMFTKVVDRQLDNDVAWGLQYIVNEKLFSGNYLLIDSSNHKTNVSFGSDGTITGLSNFKTYYVITDFMGGRRQFLTKSGLR